MEWKRVEIIRYVLTLHLLNTNLVFDGSLSVNVVTSFHLEG